MPARFSKLKGGEKMTPKRSRSVLSTKSCRLMTMLMLTSSFFFVELIIGYVTHSLALVADSFHMLSDIIALIVGFVAVRYSKCDTPKNTYGWQRAEVVGALVNAVFLFALCFTIVVDAVERLILPEEINDPRLVLIVGGVGLVVNLLGMLLFSSHGMGHGHSHGGGLHGHGHSHGAANSQDDSTSSEKAVLRNGTVDIGLESMDDKMGQDVEAGVVATESSSSPNSQQKHNRNSASATQLNMRGVFLHVLGDALGSVVVMISALVVMFVDANWSNYIDPVLSIIIAVIICSTTLPLFKQSSMILLQSLPTGIDIEHIENKLREECSCINNIHEFHVWQLTGAKLIGTLHVSVSSLEEYCGLVKQVTKVLNEEGIYSITIQPEVICVKHECEDDCSIPCRHDATLAKNKCCGGRALGNRSTVSMSALQTEVNDIEKIESKIVQKSVSTQTYAHEMDNHVYINRPFEIKIISTV